MILVVEQGAMMKRIMVVMLLSILLNAMCGSLNGVQTQPSAYVPVLSYDPSRNATQDLHNAEAEAGRTGKRVLVEIGGEWASWCQVMSRFFQEHRDLLELRDANYVTVAINFSKENQNREALSKYPGIFEFPHLLVLDADGRLLQSQQTSLL